MTKLPDLTLSLSTLTINTISTTYSTLSRLRAGSRVEGCLLEQVGIPWGPKYNSSSCYDHGKKQENGLIG